MVKKQKAVFLMSDESGEKAKRLAKGAGLKLDAKVVSSLEKLKKSLKEKPALLLSFGTSVIVPGKWLQEPSLLALNVHAASPQYPGRDPHHFAVYENVKFYGATLHFMEREVDSGQIVDVELFRVIKGTTPSKLLKLANMAGWRLIKRFLGNYAANRRPKPLSGIRWRKRKTTRKRFLKLCRIDPHMSKKEVHRRKLATAMPGFSNLYTQIRGLRFRFDEKSA
jgi:methionyl-tRNA formyltransferase